MNRRNNFGRKRRGDGHRGRGGRGRGNFNRNFNQKHNTPLTQPEQLTETEVGITEFISKLDGFSGVIKARFSDFQVSEIDSDGIVAKITNRAIPEAFVVKKLDKEPAKDSPTELIPQEKWDELIKLSKSQEDFEVVIDVSEYDKEKRNIMHKSIKGTFREKVVAKTVDEDGKKFIKLKKYSPGGDRHDKLSEWPENAPEYVHFLLYKESMDTMEAVMRISDCLRISASAFNYAGVKDRRAKTTQWMSVRRVEPWKLLFKTKPIRSVQIGNVVLKDHPLKLGHLSGNRFQVALRNVTADDEFINKSLESLKNEGFINYYGLQRFGNDKEVPTYEIGIKLLQGNWKEACNLILKPKKCEDPLSEITQAKKAYQETSNAKVACMKLNQNYNTSIESKLLNGLANGGPNDFVTALESIPRYMRLLYIHAFQSLVWNKAVSRRIKDLGLKPVVGDLVIVENSEESKMDAEETVDVIEKEDGNVKEDKKDEGEESGKLNEAKEEAESSDKKSKDKKNLDDEDIETDKNTEQVKILTETDLENYTIYDVVLPLPGYNITYPENSVKDFYKETLEKYSLKLEMTQQKVKTYTLKGNYRKILAKPTDLSWKCLNYSDPNDNLIRSDFEEMLGHKEPVSKPDGQYKALVVSFNLNSSCYATMVLREILKIDTSSRSQAKLNNYHDKLEPAKTPTNGSHSSSTEAEANQNSLLTDKDKFEAFKKAVFADTPVEEPVKRKIEEDPAVEAKKAKLDEAKKEDGIKIQASLI